jgi:CPA2 family monovalent cation:H+ antiporter-2
VTGLPSLVNDLALILVTAAAVALLIQKLKAPGIVSYLIAGALVGPQAGLLPSVSNPENLRQWADLGVIILLFYTGLEFSFRRLFEIGGSLVIVASLSVGGLALTGYGLALSFGWTGNSAFILSCLVALSSTSIVLKTYGDLDLHSQAFAQHTLGLLILEDLFSVFLLIVIAALTISQNFSGDAILGSGLQSIVLFVTFVIVSVLIFPFLLKHLRSILQGESLVLLSLGLCFAMSWIAHKSEISAALGAFIMGSLLGDSEYRHKLQVGLEPIKNLFSAIFFVSIGMLVDLKIILDAPVFTACVILLVAFGKPFFVAAAAILTGRPLKKSLQMGLSMGQIGEFSFLIAATSKNLPGMPIPLESLAAVACVGTTLSTSFFLRYRDSVSASLEASLPKKLSQIINNYSTRLSSARWDRDLLLLQNQITLRMLINSILVIALFWLGSHLSTTRSSALFYTLTLLASSPFLWAFVFSKSRQKDWSGILKKVPPESFFSTIYTIRLILGLGLIALLSLNFWDLSAAKTLPVALILFGIMLAVTIKKIRRIYFFLESRFLENWRGSKLQKGQKIPALDSWDAHLAEFEVQQNADFAGCTLQELKWRSQFGVAVTLVERGDQLITPPSGNTRLMPLDRFFAVGTDEQLREFADYLRSSVQTPPPDSKKLRPEDFRLAPILLNPQSRFVGKTLQNLDWRAHHHTLVLAVEKNGRKYFNPNPQAILEAGDVLWIFGTEDLIQKLE